MLQDSKLTNENPMASSDKDHNSQYRTRTIQMSNYLRFSAGVGIKGPDDRSETCGSGFEKRLLTKPAETCTASLSRDVLKLTGN